MSKKRQAKFKLKQSTADDKWYFTLVSTNGKVVCQSQGYTRKASALAGIECVQTLGKKAVIVEVPDGE